MKHTEQRAVAGREARVLVRGPARGIAWWVGVVAVCAAASCDVPDPSPGWRTTVDSTAMGPVRVVNEPLSDSIPITGRVEETFLLGGPDVEGPTSFGVIAQLAADPLGRLAVLDRQAAELRIFDLDGNHLGTFGREGSGPGELRWAFGVVRDGEKLLVPEQGNARVSVFHPDSGFVASYPYEFRSYGYQGWDAVVDTAGRLVVPSSGLAGEEAGGGQLVLRIFDRRMEPLDTIPYTTYAEVDQGEAYRIQTRPGGSALVPVPFHGRTFRRLDRTGTFWRVEAGPDYRLKRHEAAGDTLRVVEVRRPTRPVTRAERDSALDAIRARFAERGIAVELDPSRVPDTHPRVHGLFLAQNGDLWVRVTPPDRDTTVYDVLDATGRIQGTVELPHRVLFPVAPVVRGDRIWAVVVDRLDVQYVLGGRIVPATESGVESAG